MPNEEEIIETDTCSACGSRLEHDAVVCYQCGSPTVPNEEWEGAYERYRTLVVGFFSINLVVCLVFNFWPPASETITGLIIVDSFLFLCAIFYAYRMRELVAPILTWHKFSWWRLLLVVTVAIVSAICVNYGVKWINRSVFDRELYYYASFRNLPFPKISMLLLIAFFPAFSEELAYRGVIQSGLLKIMHSRQAVVMTALLFAIIHMSIISFVWLLPFALFLGYVRQRTHTIWYGIFIHFFFNATTCFLELHELGLL
ncbi:CPBP family intramembrane glutamic endopeptidase [Flavihumibacter fluvii]|uniref:CPBP family intramembrane glutamic endopeptidase n=1 Tax=Flavihumibacter fluvii TaxID=2838157 RepID=UPI001BDDD6C5|nr:type II CAAX endopeptidase family protein [Flavihumibacter fluvii]ULQ51345.1 CPBP family intramembrane metalloprotease [Flavihumibacter fluvii]